MFWMENNRSKKLKQNSRPVYGCHSSTPCIYIFIYWGVGVTAYRDLNIFARYFLESQFFFVSLPSVRGEIRADK